MRFFVLIAPASAGLFGKSKEKKEAEQAAEIAKLKKWYEQRQRTFARGINADEWDIYGFRNDPEMELWQLEKYRKLVDPNAE